VVRIGDFYHSKIVIRDVNISYEDGPWDMNPEGIGYQPMVATVQLQVSFIGGQGLEKPVEKLQNALSSNFFGNTEIFDERSISTATTIDGKNADTFTKEFLEQLAKKPEFQLINDINTPGTQVYQGVTIGNYQKDNLDYTQFIKDIYTIFDSYVKVFQSSYSEILSKYGHIIAGLLFASKYRPKNNLDVNNTPTTTTNLNLIGLFDDSKDMFYYIKKFKSIVDIEIDFRNLSIDVFELFDSSVDELTTETESSFKPIIKKLIDDKIDGIGDLKIFKDLDVARNKVIEIIDFANFMVKYGKDCQISGSTYYEIPLTGFSQTDFYSQYEQVITYCNSTYVSMDSKFNIAYDFNTLDGNKYSISTEETKKLLRYLVKDDLQPIREEFKKNEISDIGVGDGNITLLEKVSIRLQRVLPKSGMTVDYSDIKPMPNAKSDKKLTYPAGEPVEIDVLDPEGKKPIMNKIMVSKKTPPVGNKLNYYKP
jgi:hypothetical protein